MRELIDIEESLSHFKSQLIRSHYDAFGAYLKNSVLFRTEIAPSDNLVGFANDLLMEDQFALPSEATVFSLVTETGIKWVVQCIEARGIARDYIGRYQINGAVFCSSPLMRRHTDLLVPLAAFQLERSESRISPIRNDDKVTKNLAVDAGKSGIIILKMSIAALASRDVVQTVVKAPEKLNKARAAKGLPHLGEYRVITIDEEIKKKIRDQMITGTRDRMPVRLHFRRGHPRRLQSGKRVLVAPCIVGSAASGVLPLPTYRLK